MSGPRPAASLLLLRPRDSGFEILFVHRNARASAFGGAVVFPGGVIDAADRSLRADVARVGADPDEVDARIAAIRECYEEAGILLARARGGGAPAASRVAGLAGSRAALHAGRLSLASILEAGQLDADLAALVPLARWITPPSEPRRFDTRFFLALAPPGQEALADGQETLRAEWLAPRAALERCERGDLALAFPTRHLVRTLEPFTDASAALDWARGQREIEITRPTPAAGSQGRRWMVPGEAAYAELRWSDPEQQGHGRYELAPGVPTRLDAHVRRIVAPNPGVLTGPGTNTYILGERDCVVLDPGPHDAQHLEAVLAATGGSISAILLTHTHSDHAGGAAQLAARSGAPLWGRLARHPHAEDVNLPFAREPGDGERIGLGGIEIEVVHTPGHASNHLCYRIVQTGMLFTGDHIMQGSTVVLAPPDGSLREYLDSLRRVAALDCAILAPGHGFLIGRPREEVGRLLAHRAAREARVLGALQATGAGLGFDALLAAVYADVPAQLHPIAAHSLEAHLEKLVGEGRVSSVAGRWALTAGA